MSESPITLFKQMFFRLTTFETIKLHHLNLQLQSIYHNR